MTDATTSRDVADESGDDRCLLEDRKLVVVMVTADLGKATGLRAGAKTLRAVAECRKSDAAYELRAVADTLDAEAATIDAKALAALAALEDVR